MGKNPGYLPTSAWTVGAMIDDQLHITWHCDACRHYDSVDLLKVAAKKGIDYCLVDRRARCKMEGCVGVVYFRYAGSPGTPSRRLEALRERQDAARVAAENREMAEAKAAYNQVAKRLRRPTLP
jgi:hypothetical protein